MKQSLVSGLAACCVVVLALGAPPAEAVPLVEVTVETDKAVYQLGETSSIVCTLYNPTDELAWAGGSTGPVELCAFENAANRDRLDLLANEEPLWYSPMFLDPFAPRLVVIPGQIREAHLAWYYSTDEGGLHLGEYELVVDIWPHEGTVIDYTNAATHITVVPEPGMLALVVMGAGALIIRPRRGGRGSVGGMA